MAVLIFSCVALFQLFVNQFAAMGNESAEEKAVTNKVVFARFAHDEIWPLNTKYLSGVAYYGFKPMVKLNGESYCLTVDKVDEFTPGNEIRAVRYVLRKDSAVLWEYNRLGGTPLQAKEISLAKSSSGQLLVLGLVGDDLWIHELSNETPKSQISVIRISRMLRESLNVMVLGGEKWMSIRDAEFSKNEAILTLSTGTPLGGEETIFTIHCKRTGKGWFFGRATTGSVK